MQKVYKADLMVIKDNLLYEYKNNGLIHPYVNNSSYKKIRPIIICKSNKKKVKLYNNDNINFNILDKNKLFILDSNSLLCVSNLKKFNSYSDEDLNLFEKCIFDDKEIINQIINNSLKKSNELYKEILKLYYKKITTSKNNGEVQKSLIKKGII